MSEVHRHSYKLVKRIGSSMKCHKMANKNYNQAIICHHVLKGLCSGMTCHKLVSIYYNRAMGCYKLVKRLGSGTKLSLATIYHRVMKKDCFRKHLSHGKSTKYINFI